MNARILELERLKAQLQLWDAEMAHLEEKVSQLRPEGLTALENEASDILQAMLEEDLKKLRQLWSEAEQALYVAEQAGDAEWPIMWERAERILGQLGEAFEQSRSRFGE